MSTIVRECNIVLLEKDKLIIFEVDMDSLF